ncbi:hypothetical protein HPB49_002120 [Dermacentor silvarum]|uniref:Uncharacterized protein n=1 Tax=Dermacentor silvarum TaxID=543639 RepID=A0ACB8DLX5_DERSI|nr:hypothetical protein HPB49_002120 [Dermacentor silvarum]
MSSVRRRARTPIGSPAYYGSSAFSASSSPFDVPPRSRSALHQSSLDLSKARNPTLSRRLRDSSWGSSECLFRPSTSALASTANYVPVQPGRRFPALQFSRPGLHATAVATAVGAGVQPVSHVQLLQVYVRVVLVRRIQTHTSRTTRP